ncbi:MAG: hypothetical protein IT445_00160 [Phycisphaeraceae bacterium]|nr:hypothetical protein [Phycisphaeraceae bacterium]
MTTYPGMIAQPPSFPPGYVTPAGPPLAPIAPPRPMKSDHAPIDVNLRITMTEDQANAALDRHGCIVAELTEDGIGHVVARSVAEDQAVAVAAYASSGGKKIGIYKLSRIISKEKIEQP